MSRGSRRAILSASVILLGVSLGACSGSSTTSGTQTSLLTKVLQSKVLIVGTITGNAPFESVNSSGQLVGYDIDIANLLAQDLGVKAQFVKTDVAGRITSLEDGKVDVDIASFTRTLTRLEVIDFTDPINVETTTLLVAANSSLTSVSQFNDSSDTIAVTAGGTNAQSVAQQLPKAHVIQLPGISDLTQAVESGQAVAATVANTQIGALMAQFPGKFKSVDGTVGPTEFDCIGVPLGDFTWYHYVNEFVDEIDQDGTAYTLYQKWFGPGQSPGPFASPPSSAVAG